MVAARIELREAAAVVETAGAEGLRCSAARGDSEGWDTQSSERVLTQLFWEGIVIAGGKRADGWVSSSGGKGRILMI